MTAPFFEPSFDLGLLRVMRRPQVQQSLQSLVELGCTPGVSLLQRTLEQFIPYATEEEPNLVKGFASSPAAWLKLQYLRLHFVVGFLQLWDDPHACRGIFVKTVTALPPPNFDHVYPWALGALAALPGTRLNAALSKLAQVFPETNVHPLMPNSRSVVSEQGHDTPQMLPLCAELDSTNWGAPNQVMHLKVTLAQPASTEPLRRYFRRNASLRATFCLDRRDNAPTFWDDCLVLTSLVDALINMADEAVAAA